MSEIVLLYCLIMELSLDTDVVLKEDVYIIVAFLCYSYHVIHMHGHIFGERSTMK